MKITAGLATIVCSLWLATAVLPQELTQDEKKELASLQQAWLDGRCPVLPANAWLFYRSGNEADRCKADSLLNRFIALQNTDSASTVFGQWPWSQGAEIGDLNVALFRSHDMLRILWDQQDNMSATTRTRYLLSCRRLLEAAKRRWDTEVFDIGRDLVAYSNIFCLWVQTLTLAGERFDDARLQWMARSQWTRWYNHISFYGIDEFASPGYNHVIFKALFDIHDFCHDRRIEKESKEIMDYVYLLQSAITHPLLKLPVTGISRDYRVFLKQADARSAVLTATPADYTPPQQALEINHHRTYPFEVTGKAAVGPFLFKSYQLADAAMGSMTGGACFQQQIHCLTAVGKNEKERAVAFIQGSNTPVNGYTDQIGTSTLCVYNRLPALWHLTQWRGDMAEYRETFGEFGLGLSDQWKVKSRAADHLVLEAYGYELHVFPFAVQEEKLSDCPLTLKHRTTSSPRYHPRPIVFDEWVFPDQPDWFGVHLVLARSGERIKDPGLRYVLQQGIRTFSTKQGHRIRLFVAEKGDTRQLFNMNPALMPVLKIGH
mgnify:FL=1